MIEINFYLFLAICELIVIFLIIVIVQSIFLKKYRPYYMANTRPELFLRKYLQHLINLSRQHGNSLQKKAAEGDPSAVLNRQHMAARLNWLILERDFAFTSTPDSTYWEDINIRIKQMLKRWHEIEFIKEPPDLKAINLALDTPDLDSLDFDNADIDEAAKTQIASLKKKVLALSGFESMYREMETAYKTLETSYDELNALVNQLQLESDKVAILKGIVERKEANEKNLADMMEEMENSKTRLNQELEQLEDAYIALEKQVEDASGQTHALQNSDNVDAQEIVNILNQQEAVLNELRGSLENLNVKPEQKQQLVTQADSIEKNNKEINHSMQMLELERERLNEEVKQLQEMQEDKVEMEE